MITEFFLQPYFFSNTQILGNPVSSQVTHKHFLFFFLTVTRNRIKGRLWFDKSYFKICTIFSKILLKLNTYILKASCLWGNVQVGNKAGANKYIFSGESVQMWVLASIPLAAHRLMLPKLESGDDSRLLPVQRKRRYNVSFHGLFTLLPASKNIHWLTNLVNYTTSSAVFMWSLG